MKYDETHINTSMVQPSEGFFSDGTNLLVLSTPFEVCFIHIEGYKYASFTLFAR